MDSYVSVIMLPLGFIILAASLSSVNEKHEINILLKNSLVVLRYSPESSDLSENAIA